MHVRWSVLIRYFAVACRLITLFISVFVLWSWSLDHEKLAHFYANVPSMLPNAAIGILLATLAMFILDKKDDHDRFWRIINYVIAFMIMMIGIAPFIESFSGKPFFINQLGMRIFYPHESIMKSGSPTLNAGLAFILFALSQLFYKRKIIIAQWMAIMIFTVAGLAMTGQAYQVGRLDHKQPLIGMAFSTACSFLLLSLSLLMNQLDCGILKHLSRASPAGDLLRRFTIAIALVPILFGTASVIGAGKSVQELLTIFTTVSILMLTGFIAVVLSSSRELIRLELIRKESEEKLLEEQKLLEEAQKVAHFGNFVWFLVEDKIYLSEEALRIFGQETGVMEPDYEHFLNLLHPDDRTCVDEAVKKAIKDQVPFSLDYRIIRPDGRTIYIHGEGIVQTDPVSKAQRFAGTVHDITDRKLSEESLRQSEELLNKIIDFMPVAVWLLDKDGNIYRANQTCKNIWGEVKLVGPEDFGLYQAWFEESGKKVNKDEWAGVRALKYGETIIGELVRILTFDGKTKVIMNSAVPLKNDKGEIEGTLVVNEDITDKRMAMLKAQEQAERLQRFLDQAADALITVDGEGNITYVNTQAEKLFSYSKEELLGQKIEILVPDRYKTRHAQQRNAYSLSPHPRQMSLGLNLIARRKNGSEFPVEISLNPVRTKDGLSVTSIIRDISERRRFEDQQKFLNVVAQELAESIDYETTLKRIAEISVPDLADWCIIHILDNKKVPQLKVAKHADPSQQPMLEAAMKSPKYTENANVGIARVIRTGAPIISPFVDMETFTRPEYDQETISILEKLNLSSYIIVPIKVGARILGTIILSHGTSGRHFGPQDRPLVEDLAQRAAFALENAKLYTEAITAIRDREDVLSVVSHDLKNPLNAIKLSTHLLEKMVGKMSEKEPTLKLFETITGATNTMESLIHNILDVSKIQAGTFTIVPRRASLHDILKTVELLFLPLATERKIELKIESPDIDFPLICDPDRVQEIFSNLVGNALKFTGENGLIVIRIKREERQVLFCVEDNGKGMSQAQMEHVFDRYWQAKETAAKGAGLGLYITKGIVLAHRGKIWVESVSGKGTRFYFTLPENNQ